MSTYRRLLCAVLMVLSLPLLSCFPTIEIQTPQPQASVMSCDVDVDFTLIGAFLDEPVVSLNFVDVGSPVIEGPPGSYQLTLGPEDGLVDQNILLIEAHRASDGERLTQGVSFNWAPKASAFQITDPGDLITGPLGHSRLGDFMLESCLARFVVQDGAQRDLYSVGQYGGNLIDAERRGRPDLDNFLEIQPMVNVETVINAQSVVVINDGSDGQPAVVRSCGPDDLLDFVNPSSQVKDAGFPFPASLNDVDQDVEGCTDFRLSAADSHIEMVTTITNLGASPIRMLSGDWMNQGGELDVVQTPNVGVGQALLAELGSMSFFGYGEAAGVDYSYTTTPPAGSPGSYVVISGVTVVLYSANVVLALLGLDPGVEVLPGQGHVMTRYLGVGEGSASNAVDLELRVKGLPNASLEGCVTVAGVAAPGARISVGVFDGIGITDLVTHFVTDEDGCYAGDVPVPVDPTQYGVVVARPGTPYQGGGITPDVNDLVFNAGSSLTLDMDLPETGRLRVTTINASSEPLPTRVTVVGFDPSPPIVLAGPSLPGFGSSAGLLVGLESRSSGPIRLPRDRDTSVADGFGNLYPIGEGAGYAGGIMSAAIDGARSALRYLRG